MLESGNFEQAEAYFEQAREQAYQFNTTIPLVEATNGTAQLYYHRQDLPSALHTIQEALTLAEKNKMPYQAAGARQVLVQILHWMKRFEEAKPELQLVIREFIPSPASNAYFLLAMLPLVYHLHAGERTTAYLSLLLNDPKQIPVFYKDPNLLSLKAQLQTDMGADNFNTAWERGKSLDLDTVVQDLLAEFAADDGM
jgi:tetratricopeptide (TPR) repeat protein